MTNGTEQKHAEVVSQETSLDPWDVAEDAEQTAIQVMTAGAAGALNRSEVEAQLDAAHRYKRSTTSFMRDAISMATLSPACTRCREAGRRSWVRRSVWRRLPPALTGISTSALEWSTSATRK